MTEKERLNLIIEAISSELKKDPGNPFIRVVQFSANKLAEIEVEKIQAALENLEHNDRILKIISMGYESSKNGSYADSLLEVRAYYDLEILDNFDSWCAAHQLKKKFSLADLSPTNLKKIYATVLDIDDKLQVNPSARVQINLVFGNERFDDLNFNRPRECREDALNYLKNKGAITSYQIQDDELDIMRSTIDIDLNTVSFLEFKDEIKAFHSPKPEPTVALETMAQKQSQNQHKKNEEVPVYEIKYTTSREILLNDLLLTKVNFDGENDNVFEYLFKNPNKKISTADLAKVVGGSLAKDLHKIIENLGFKGDLRKAFFDVSKTSICFRNPVFQKHLNDLGISRIRLPR